MKQQYIQKSFTLFKLDMIEKGNRILEEYARMGYTMTMRQLYYQFVSRDLLPPDWFDPQYGSTNNPKSYKKLVNYFSEARLAGLVDWGRLEDITRGLEGLSHWSTPAEILDSAEHSYRRNKWEGQEWRVEVWVEKDALRSVISQVANRLDVPHFSCRGYTSQSEMRQAGLRIMSWYLREERQRTLILHLSDHDPSGLDMTRDVIERLEMFAESAHGHRFQVVRVALNYDQVEQYSPPPNFAKEKDSRFGDYSAQYGDESWELDALSPPVIADLIENAVAPYRNDGLYQEQVDQEERERLDLRMMRLQYKRDNGLPLEPDERETWEEETGETLEEDGDFLPRQDVGGF